MRKTAKELATQYAKKRFDKVAEGTVVDSILASAGKIYEPIGREAQALAGHIRSGLANPQTRMQTAILTGAGAGALGGLLDARPEESRINSMLRGAVLGGGVGGGALFLHDKLRSAQPNANLPTQQPAPADMNKTSADDNNIVASVAAPVIGAGAASAGANQLGKALSVRDFKQFQSANGLTTPEALKNYWFTRSQGVNPSATVGKAVLKSMSTNPRVPLDTALSRHLGLTSLTNNRFFEPIYSQKIDNKIRGRGWASEKPIADLISAVKSKLQGMSQVGAFGKMPGVTAESLTNGVGHAAGKIDRNINQLIRAGRSVKDPYFGSSTLAKGMTGLVNSKAMKLLRSPKVLGAAGLAAAADLAIGPNTMGKTSADVGETMRNLLAQITQSGRNFITDAKTNPLNAGVIGAGLGAGAGVIGGMRRPKGQRSLLADAAMGAAAGGALGVGAPNLLAAIRSATNGTVAQGSDVDALRQQLEQQAKTVSPGGALTNMAEGAGNAASAVASRPLTSLAALLGLGGSANSVRHAMRNGVSIFDPLSEIDPSYWFNRSTVDDVANSLGRNADKLLSNPDSAAQLKSFADVIKNDPQARIDFVKTIGNNSWLTNGMTDILDSTSQTPAGEWIKGKQPARSILMPGTIQDAAREGRTIFSPYFGSSTSLQRNIGRYLPKSRTGILTAGGLIAADMLSPFVTGKSLLGNAGSLLGGSSSASPQVDQSKVDALLSSLK